MKNKKNQIRNLSYTSIDYDIDLIKYKLRMLEMDKLINHLFVDEDESEYILVEKMITFADVPTFAKYVYTSDEKKRKNSYDDDSIKERVKKNILFYNSIDEMISFEKKNKKNRRFFVQTKQGNIHLPKEFYSFLGKREPKDYSNVNGKPRFVFESDKYNIYLVRESLDEYFDMKKTNACINILRGNTNFSEDWKQGTCDYQKISLSTGVHGIGSHHDDVFHKLRGNIFARDKMLIACKKNKQFTEKYDIYFMFFRNPKFFKLMGLGIKEYSSHLFQDGLDASKEESRAGQSKWRDMLAEFDISDNDSDVVKCPISGLEVVYLKEGTILRASHIKEYSKCKDELGKIKIEEAYDINNGLLVSADVDALFDKHLISINPNNGEIEYSKFISSNLKRQLHFNKKIDKKYISNERKVYLEYHWNRFNSLEKDRNLIQN